jgi:hypothetical protein
MLLLRNLDVGASSLNGLRDLAVLSLFRCHRACPGVGLFALNLAPSVEDMPDNVSGWVELADVVSSVHLATPWHVG